MATWFSRLADIPGVGYPGSEGVVRTALKWHDAVPTIETVSFDGKRYENVIWPSGSTLSPVQDLLARTRPKSPKAARRQLAQALELPGSPTDYHFAIQGCLDLAYKHRRDDPSLLEEVEHLAWLDIRLIEACPSAIRMESDPEGQYFNVAAFFRLISLYEKEGFIREALEVAERAARFGQGDDLDDLRERLTKLESEHVE